MVENAGMILIPHTLKPIKMRKPFKIGQKEYKFKKDAIAYYQAILNSYDFGQSLNDSDYEDIVDLIDYKNSNYPIEIYGSEQEVEDEEIDNNLIIEDIKIARVQFNTKCFEVFYKDQTSQYISYIMIINNKKYTPESLFYVACRNSVHDDIRAVKQDYFDKNSVKGQVKCQETGKLSKWTELAIDHRQPNTFSIIVDRFKEVTKIDLENLEYTSTEQNHIIFKNEYVTKAFKKYHKEKANLRIVRKECNSSRTGMARIKKTNKDLKIK
jgi:hypothetical protein